MTRLIAALGFVAVLPFTVYWIYRALMAPNSDDDDGGWW